MPAQALSFTSEPSFLFSTDLCGAELFISDTGSDCGVVKGNIGTTSAEIGDAFWGEKQAGSDRE
jgi:aldehyde dehydrogenase (NAD+)